MPRFLERLHKGERLWPAEIFLRSLGLALLLGCFKLALLAHRLVIVPQVHQPTLDEFALCLAIILALTSGLALAIEGPGLFRRVPIPPTAHRFERLRN